MEWFNYLLAVLAAFFAGAINALAGGGTLITFPVLTFIGLSPVAANITSTVALFPGYFGATYAQRKDLKGQAKRLLWFLPAAALGGLVGALLLLYSGDKIFIQLIPFLILLASLLLALGEPLRKWLNMRDHDASNRTPNFKAAALPVGLAAIYGGYFGAGLSVIVLAVLGLHVEDNLTRLNALKQAIAFATNITAAVYFLFSSQVVWSFAILMAVFALLGGAAGGRLAGRIQPRLLRWIVIIIGIAVSIYYFIRISQ